MIETSETPRSGLSTHMTLSIWAKHSIHSFCRPGNKTALLENGGLGIEAAQLVNSLPGPLGAKKK
jgi:hypothetical protein